MKPRKYDAIDIVKMMDVFNLLEWNQKILFWTMHKDVKKVQAILYAMQGGMADANKKKQVTDDLSLWFIGIQRQLEGVLKNIWRNENRHPLQIPKSPFKTTKKSLADKRAIDKQLEINIRKGRF